MNDPTAALARLRHLLESEMAILSSSATPEDREAIIAAILSRPVPAPKTAVQHLTPLDEFQPPLAWSKPPEEGSETTTTSLPSRNRSWPGS